MPHIGSGEFLLSEEDNLSILGRSRNISRGVGC